MTKCPECDSDTQIGALFCGECGAYLLTNDAPEIARKQPSADQPAQKHRTIKLPLASDTVKPKYKPPFANNLKPKPPTLLGQELGPVIESRELTFIIPNSGRRVVLTLKEELSIGRSDAASSRAPDLDLSPDNAAQLGVSRVHALIQRVDRGVTIMDFGSTNGTLLNNYRLPPDLPYSLRSGDEIRFGHLLVHVFFE